MAHTILVFDFGTDEEAAQQARQKIDRWKQGFRLGDKLNCKFEREETAEAAGAEEGEADSEAKKGEKKSSSAKKHKSKSEHASKKENGGGHVRMFVRLGFSDHEKLSQQRWLDRIPSEEPFKSAKGETIRHSDPEFAKSAELYESLD
jgi:hypothetical protein